MKIACICRLERVVTEEMGGSGVDGGSGCRPEGCLDGENTSFASSICIYKGNLGF